MSWQNGRRTQPLGAKKSFSTNTVRSVLKLDAENTQKFRRLCLLSADAVYRGIRSTHNDITPWWTRDQYIGRPPLPSSPEALQRVLAEKDESVRMWTEIVSLANAIRFPDPKIHDYVVTSAQYGRDVYRIYQLGFQLAALGPLATPADKAKAAPLLRDYDQIWADYRQLPQEHSSCATLYTDRAFNGRPGIGEMVEKLRKD